MQVLESVLICKNPYDNQYKAPYGYGFFYNGQFQGTIIWRDNVEGYELKKLQD